jgi:hypothetical protein
MAPQASTVVTVGFIVIPLLLCAALVLGSEWAGRRLGEPPRVRARWAIGLGVGSTVWLLGTGILAASGILRQWDRVPPPFAGLVVAILALSLAISCSRLGARLVRGLPLAALVGFQVFRFPLELLMHRAYTEGVMPVQMSYSGRNFDILTGLTAGLLGLALWRGRPRPWQIALWNLGGFALLVNVVTVAFLSTPTFRWFGDDHLNTWVTYPPFVWLPAVMVAAALAGHVLVLRWLLSPAPPPTV